MIIKQKKEWIAYIGIFLLLFLSAGFTVTNDILSNFLTKLLWLLLLTVLAMNTRMKCNRRQFTITLTLCLLIFASSFVNNGNLVISIMHCVQFVSAMFLVEITSQDKLLKAYTDILYYLCVLSLFCYVIFWLIPDIRSLFLVTNASGNVYSDILVFSFNNKVNGIPRNQGMFWEPGAFGTFIIFALVFETMGEKINPKHLGVFLATVITTFSTTAYFATSLYVLFLLFKYRSTAKNRRLMLALICMTGIAVALLWDFLFAKGTYSVFGKLIDFIDGGSYGNKVTSVSVRIDSVIKPIGVFFQYPILGCGMEKLRRLLFEYTHGMNTCTFVNWFAVYGLLFGSIMLVGIIKVSASITEKKMLRIVVVLLLLMAIMTENFTNSPVVFMLALLGYKRKDTSTTNCCNC
jgi:hypothetical protein